MDPLSIGITLGSSIIGGLLSSSAEAEKEKKIRDQVRRAQALARQGLISKEMLASRLRDIDRLFNKRLISTLSSTAFGGRRLANANVAGASVAGQLGGQAEASKVGYQEQADRINATIYQHMANLEAGAPITSSLEAGVTGALGGAQVGLSLSNIINSKVPEIPQEDIPYNEAGSGMPSGLPSSRPTAPSIVDSFRGNNQNPFGGTVNLPNKIEDDDLFSFGLLKRSLF